MSEAAIRLDRPIAFAELLDGPAFADENVENAQKQSISKGSANSAASVTSSALSRACQALNEVVARLNESHAAIFSEHREEIARLSVEIARKVLVQKVDEGDYEIESIVKEALGHAPSRHDVVVHLNPDDLEQCRMAQQRDEQGGDPATGLGTRLAGIQFVADPNIGRAECLIESPKGIIKSLIDEHLNRIGKALRKAE